MLLTVALFRILQKYKFESKSQLVQTGLPDLAGCLGYYKNTNLKANHNLRLPDNNRTRAV